MVFAVWWPYTAKATQKKILELNWTVIPYPPYLPDLAPSDFHLFCSLHNHLREKRFENEIRLVKFFDSIPPEFYSRGIDKLPERWE
jgi:histone-lysine N-methyltransferase SETMAR